MTATICTVTWDVEHGYRCTTHGDDCPASRPGPRDRSRGTGRRTEPEQLQLFPDDRRVTTTAPSRRGHR